MAYFIILINLIIFTSGKLVSINIQITESLAGFVSTDSSCGDWTSHRDEKCFKVFDTPTQFSGAAQVCQKDGANIGIIRSAEEQGLVVANLKNQRIVDNVWIGIKKNGKSFVSLDGNALKYTNWANGRPLNQTDVDCVELSEENQDKWIDVKCEKKNAVLCEKSQQWSKSKIENVLQQIRNNYSERMDSLEANLETRKKELDQIKQNLTLSLNLIDAQRKELDQLKRNHTNLIDTHSKEIKQLEENQTSSLNFIDTQRKELDIFKQNPVPIGFIYVQLSGQSEPHTLWPQTEWNNVSPEYAGLFFRAEGGQAATFGKTQSEQARSLQIYNGWCDDNPKGCSAHDFRYNKNSYTVNTNFYEKTFYTGEGGVDQYGINFKYTTDENRPRNQAIRIWIRIK